ncbi:MAG: thiol-disulfide oxidoreductase DCC family protein, partial [Methylococcaceae bacterium]
GLSHRGNIEWIDVTRESARLIEWGLSSTEAMARFHVMDGEGRFHVGADGFLLLWSHLAGYRYLAAFCTAARVQPLLRWVYEHFARWHFRRRCPGGQCGINT